MRLKILFGVLIAALFSACSPYNYYSVSNRPLDPHKYKTFAWIPEGKSRAGSIYDNDVARDKIVESATQELTNRGFQLSNGRPDLLIRYTAMVNRTVKEYSDPVYYYAPPVMPYYRGRGRFYYNYVSPFPIYVGDSERRIRIRENSIVIDIIDRRSSKVIWRGWAEGELDNPERAINEIPQVIANIFKKLS